VVYFKTMTSKLFKSVTYLFHPVFMPVAGIFMILAFSHLSLLPTEGKRAILLIVALTTLFFPLAMLPVFYYQRMITGIQVSERRERLVPMFTASLFYYFGYYILHRYAAPTLLQQFLLASFVSVFMASIIHLKWKISLHMIGIGGFIGLLSSLGILYQIYLDSFLMISIFIAGLIGSARLYLNEHNHTQIYAGFMLGFISTTATLLIFNG